MNSLETLVLMSRLVGGLGLVHGIEFWFLKESFSDRGVWRWADLKPEIGTKWPLRLNQHFLWINGFRLLMALTLIAFPTWEALMLLLLVHISTLIRWRGSFNGGSDAMYLLLLWTLALATAFPEGDMPVVCLYYVTFQLCLSYFKAGYFKLKRPEWRNGKALVEFVNSEAYEQKPWLSRCVQSAPRFWAWLILIFEVSFPLSLLHPHLAVAYMVVGALFHLGNAYVFSLNRFLWAWLAAYPALYFVPWHL